MNKKRVNAAAREGEDSRWNGLLRAGGIAALVAGILFRRNLGVEIAIFSPQKQPETVLEWFTLLQNNRLLGLAYLSIFDIVNYALIGLMFLALFAALYRSRPGLMTAALAAGLMGIGVYFATNTALSLLSLSSQYVAAAGEDEQTQLLAAGQALLAMNRFSSAGAQPGAGGYLSLLLIAGASLMVSLGMLRSGLFGRATAWVGIVASALDLAYCVGYAWAPDAAALLGVLFIPAAGLLLMVWHILVGLRLVRMARAGRAVREPHGAAHPFV